MQSEYLIMLIPALVAVAGGFLSLVWHPSHQMRSLIQHFAAGVVLAALAVELLPEIGREHAQPWVLIAAFAAGSLFMFGMKLLTDKLEAGSHAAGQNAKTALPIGLLVATLIDIATDGFIIGAGFASGGETGLILALGLSVELLFLGLALMSDALRGWKMIALTCLLGVEVFAFAVLGKWLLAGVSHDVLGAVLAASAAALLYLVTEELLMEAHEVEEKNYAVLVLFAGFLTFWSIQLLA
jgi:ZIP family zinc transporter